ncbi:zinc-dependent alcohol dehydrogenase family protein [Niallia sp. 03133]|uniref:zinc-dependent alcohol dehydrogenase family protein n=1 Tax=Niallia sp. 03133 TaxID=3458060 RepID=UPI0040450411
MKAQIIEKFGDPSVFQLAEIERPVVISGHVLIKVTATSVNPIDTKVRSGAVAAAAPDFPAVIHGDVAGIVEEVGDGVTAFKAGDEVFGCAGGFKGTGGALAQYMLADAAFLAHKPKNISMEEAAVIPLVALTAWGALFEKGNLTAGQKILIHGAAGGVGHMAIQLAKWAGAKVYTTASTQQKMELAKELGADAVINYKEQSVQEYVEQYTGGKGFPVVFDTVGGKNLDHSFEAAALNGSVLAIAARSTHDLSPMHSKGLSLHVEFLLLKILNKEHRKDLGSALTKIAKLVEEGKLRPLIDEKVFSFDEISQAHDYLESGKAIGKIAIKNTW